MKLKTFALLLSVIILAVTCEAQKRKMKQQTLTLNTSSDKLSYSLGVSIGENLKKQGLDSINTNILAAAINNVFNKDSLLINPGQANQIIQEHLQGLQGKQSEVNLKAGEKFLAENKTKEGIITLPSGLQYKVLKEGTGPQPKLTDKVMTHYHGTLVDGRIFDSSVERGEPLTFPVNGVISGWTEALQLMKVGSKWKLFIPSHLAYGERGAGGGLIGPNETLIFEVELLEIK